MPGIAAVHHPLRDVDTGSGDVLPLIHIGDVMDRAAVNAHPDRQSRLRTQNLTDLKGAFHRIFHRAGEDQRHPVARGQQDELTDRFRFTRRFGIAHDLIQFVERFRLLVDEQLGITDDVDEKDMRDLQAQFRFLVVGHLGRDLSASRGRLYLNLGELWS